MKKRQLWITLACLCFVILCWFFTEKPRPSGQSAPAGPGEVENVANPAAVPAPAAKAPKKNLPPPPIPETAAKPVGKWDPHLRNLTEEDKQIWLVDGLVGDTRELTATAVRHFGLLPDEEKQVNAAFKKAFNSAQEYAAKNMQTLEDPSGLGRYRIPASPETGKKIVEDLTKNLEAAAGEERGVRILNTLNIYRYYGGFGLLDTELKFTDEVLGDPAIGSITMTHYQYESGDPVNGQKRSYGTGMLATISKYYGNLFELKQQ